MEKKTISLTTKTGNDVTVVKANIAYILANPAGGTTIHFIGSRDNLIIVDNGYDTVCELFNK